MVRLLTNVKFWLLAVVVTWISVVTVILAESPNT